MRRHIATGLPTTQHAALVSGAIAERMTEQGISREDATRQVLDELYAPRACNIESWTAEGAVIEVVVELARALRRVIRRPARRGRRARSGGADRETEISSDPASIGDTSCVAHWASASSSAPD